MREVEQANIHNATSFEIDLGADEVPMATDYYQRRAPVKAAKPLSKKTMKSKAKRRQTNDEYSEVSGYGPE